MKAGVNYHVIEAFEINDKANDVYQQNFGHRPYQVLCNGLSWMFFYFIFRVNPVY